MGGNADLLSLFLTVSEDIFGEEDIIDELLDFFVAASQTTSFVSITILSHLALNKQSLAKVRSEF